jgi:hypothetical protein
MSLNTRWARSAAALAVVLALVGVFLLYSHPDVLVALTNQVWACF